MMKMLSKMKTALSMVAPLLFPIVSFPLKNFLMNLMPFIYSCKQLFPSAFMVRFQVNKFVSGPQLGAMVREKQLLKL